MEVSNLIVKKIFYIPTGSKPKTHKKYISFWNTWAWAYIPQSRAELHTKDMYPHPNHLSFSQIHDQPNNLPVAWKL